MARIEVNSLNYNEKQFSKQNVVDATYTIGNIDNTAIIQIDTYSGQDKHVTQCFQIDENNLSQLLSIIFKHFKSANIQLLEKGDIKYGINWGHRNKRNPNQAYLDLSPDIYNSDFFPPNENPFIVRTDDGQEIKFVRAQKAKKGTKNGHVLQTPDDNALLGRYLRNRLNVNEGDLITKDSILNYGRDYITISKCNDFYFLDFSSPKSKKIDTSFTPKYYDRLPIQQIVYGSPGTGKSYGIDEIIQQYYSKGSVEETEFVFRTTFHPDTDYSTFVGCYKPTKVIPDRNIYSVSELKSLYQKFKNTYGASPEIKFAGRYYSSIEPLSKKDQMEIFEGSQDTVIEAEIPNAICAAQAFAEAHEESVASITYSFVPQSFAKAYITAWKCILKGNNKPVFLIIEEINRGNCAQIFGDLFQLLDRGENGRSSYPIKPDIEFGKFIKGELCAYIDNTPEELHSVLTGENIILPENLHIWATMNTSDQSLFPIDSAFKRRWDWKFIRINEGKENDGTTKLNYRIKFIVPGDDNPLDVSWWDFLKSINKEIYEATKSEDKKLGYFFCKPDKEDENGDKKIISAETFVGKVVFYLWQDVFKDYGFKSSVFKKSDNTKITFEDFYPEDEKIDPQTNPEGLNLSLTRDFIINVIKKNESSSEA